MIYLHILWLFNFIVIIGISWVIHKRILIINKRLDICGKRIEALHKRLDIEHYLTTGKDLDTYGERNETD